MDYQPMGNYFKYQLNKIPKILDQTESQNIYLGKIIFRKKSKIFEK